MIARKTETGEGMATVGKHQQLLAIAEFAHTHGSMVRNKKEL
jgi:hypothetical protein